MKTWRLGGAAAGALVLVAVAYPAAAHHSFSAEFDPDAPVTLQGTIVRMEWINPHAWLHVDVQNEDGTTTTWMIESATPNTLFRRGFTRDSVRGRHRDHRTRLPGSQRRQSGKRPRPDPGRRLPALYGLARHWRSGRRERGRGAVVEGDDRAGRRCRARPGGDMARFPPWAARLLPDRPGSERCADRERHQHIARFPSRAVRILLVDVQPETGTEPLRKR